MDGWGWRLELQSLGQWAAIRFHNPISEADLALRIPAADSFRMATARHPSELIAILCVHS
jgi:hypothetical protein